MKLNKILKNENFWLIIIIAIGAFFRFIYLDWDQGLAFHPDEINIINAVRKIDLFKKLNPNFFAYGSFSIYLIRAIAEIWANLSNNALILINYETLNLIGRFLSALFSTISIYLIFVLGKKLANWKVGLLSSILLALSPGLIQYAHYSVNESLIVCSLILMMILSINYYQKANFLNLAFLAVISGLVISTKISSIIFLIIPFVYWLMLFKKQKMFPNITHSLFFIILSFTAFIITSPYYLLDFANAFKSLSYESQVALGTNIVPYTLQFKDKIDYLFPLQNLLWQTNFLIPILGIIGLFLWLTVALNKKEYSILPVFIFTILFFLITGAWHTKFIRYFLPLIPIFVLACSWFLIKILEIKKLKLLRFAFIGMVVIISLFWTLSYIKIFAKESTRITASKWINQNIEKNKVLLIEEWDYHLPAFNNEKYQYIVMENFRPDDDDKFSIISNELSSGEYLVIASRRIYGAISNAKSEYSKTNEYYQKMFDGSLGYEKIAEFSSYPNLFGLEIKDDQTEETFQVYDHPVIYIFQNKKHYTGKELNYLLSM